MSKTITISLSDATYEALQAAAAQAHRPPEEIAESALAERFGSASRSSETPPLATSPSDASGTLTPEQWRAFQERFLAVMRERGHLVDPSTLPPYPGTENLPPRGTPERAEFEERLAQEIGEAWAKSGMSILDLIER